MVMRAQLDFLIEQPELVTDVEAGAVPDDRCWLRPEEFDGDPPPPFLPECPFDRAGRTQGQHFFHADTGRLSPLYTGPALDPARPLLSHGPFVHSLEKRYATATETSRHLWREGVFEPCLTGDPPPAPAPEGERHLVLCDPRGWKGEWCARVAVASGDLERAIAAADRLSRMLDIRFVVATVRMSYCTR